jgi:hypothetical protein
MFSKARMKWAIVFSLAAFATTCTAWGCLRGTLDDRAVQWSSLIVTAKLTTLGTPGTLGATSRPSDATAGSYQILDFIVSSALDGKASVGDHLSVIRFMAGGDAAKASACDEDLTPDKIGKGFLLLLRPEADLDWHAGSAGDDPRTDLLHQAKAYAIVHIDSLDEIGADGLADAKYTVTTTRAAEAQFNADDAKTQAETVVNAADDTEEQQAEHALTEMGPKALPVIKAEIAKADEDGKAKLAKIVTQLMPPGLGDEPKGN